MLWIKENYKLKAWTWSTQHWPCVAHTKCYMENCWCMVQAQSGVTCLGFVDRGSHPKASIVIGAYQLEDNLLQFDLSRSRLGLSSSLNSRRTNCANFNFTSSPWEFFWSYYVILHLYGNNNVNKIKGPCDFGGYEVWFSLELVQLGHKSE